MYYLIRTSLKSEFNKLLEGAMDFSCPRLIVMGCVAVHWSVYCVKSKEPQYHQLYLVDCGTLDPH